MSKKIFLPTAEQACKMIGDSWLDFRRKARENGYEIRDDVLGNLMRDCFAAGYSYGNNDMLNIIRDQLNADYVANEIMNNR